MKGKETANDREVTASADDSAWTRHYPLAPLPRSDASADARGHETHSSVPGGVRSQRHGDGVLDAQRRRSRVRARADHGTVRSLQKPDAGVLRHPGELELHPCG